MSQRSAPMGSLGFRIAIGRVELKQYSVIGDMVGDPEPAETRRRDMDGVVETRSCYVHWTSMKEARRNRWSDLSLEIYIWGGELHFSSSATPRARKTSNLGFRERFPMRLALRDHH